MAVPEFVESASLVAVTVMGLVANKPNGLTRVQMPVTFSAGAAN
jgi:hypothetical protein